MEIHESFTIENFILFGATISFHFTVNINSNLYVCMCVCVYVRVYVLEWNIYDFCTHIYLSPSPKLFILSWICDKPEQPLMPFPLHIQSHLPYDEFFSCLWRVCVCVYKKRCLRQSSMTIVNIWLLWCLTDHKKNYLEC